MAKAYCPNPACVWLINRETDIPVCSFGYCIHRRMQAENQKKKLKSIQREVKTNEHSRKR